MAASLVVLVRGRVAPSRPTPPAPAELVGRTVTGVTRHGKWPDLATQDGPHLLAHLSRAGWLRWYDVAPATPVRPGKSPIALRVVLDLPDRGSLARRPSDVPPAALKGPSSEQDRGVRSHLSEPDPVVRSEGRRVVVVD